MYLRTCSTQNREALRVETFSTRVRKTRLHPRPQISSLPKHHENSSFKKQKYTYGDSKLSKLLNGSGLHHSFFKNPRILIESLYNWILPQPTESLSNGESRITTKFQISFKMTNFYVTLLKTHPWKANLTSAALLMLLGDGMAQYLEYEAERRKSGDAAFPQIQTQSKNFSKLRRRDTLNMKRYDLKEGERRNNNSGSANFTQMPLGFFDPVRSASMIGWSTLAVTPLFMQLFRFMETYLPKGKTGSLPARVLLTTSCAFPMNVLFFTYATCTHYLIEELYVSSPSMLDWEKILRNMKNETRLKLQQEYWNTTQNSVMYWSPINAINHAFVPPHMKTVFLNGFQMVSFYCTNSSERLWFDSFLIKLHLFIVLELLS